MKKPPNLPSPTPPLHLHHRWIRWCVRWWSGSWRDSSRNKYRSQCRSHPWRTPSTLSWPPGQWEHGPSWCRLGTLSPRCPPPLGALPSAHPGQQMSMSLVVSEVASGLWTEATNAKQGCDITFYSLELYRTLFPPIDHFQQMLKRSLFHNCIYYL